MQGALLRGCALGKLGCGRHLGVACGTRGNQRRSGRAQGNRGRVNLRFSEPRRREPWLPIFSRAALRNRQMLCLCCGKSLLLSVSESRESPRGASCNPQSQEATWAPFTWHWKAGTPSLPMCHCWGLPDVPGSASTFVLSAHSNTSFRGL